MKYTNFSPRSQKPLLLADILPEVLTLLCINRPETLLEIFRETQDERYLTAYKKVVGEIVEEEAA
jgi:hypothetical protein